MIEGKWFAQGADIAQPLAVRAAALGMGRDETDDTAQQVVVYREGAPVGTARLWWAEGAFRLGGVCVLPQERGRGYGDLLVRLLLFKALTHGASLIALDCPANVEPFFRRYGFAGENGQLSIRAEDVHLSHCGGHCDGCGA